MTEKYSFLSTVPDDINNCEYHHSKNIVLAAKKIFKKLTYYDEIVTIAEMQSGKSEVMKRLIYVVKNFNKNLQNIGIKININNIYLIICASSKNLKDQLKQKLPEIQSHIYHINDLQKFIKNRFEYEYLLSKMVENSLILFDECHCDAKKKSIVDKFRYLLDINKSEYLSSYYKVGFSATPYEQVIAKCPKIIMNPGDNYYGICNMFKSLKYGIPVIFQSKNLHIGEECSDFFDEVGIKNFYYIFRLPTNKNKSDEVINNIENQFKIRSAKFNSYIYDMHHKDNINNILRIKPKKPCIIYLKNKLRMGETLDTKYVFVLHNDPNNENTHTTVQSLLGRCCGYNKEKNRVIIYCDMVKAYQHYKWVKNNYSLDYVPTDTKYVNKTSKKVKDICIYSN